MGKLKNCEIEHKFNAEHITWEWFDFFIDKKEYAPLRLIKKQIFYGCDDYYRLGRSVIRHRFGGSTNQLTVKLRKSRKSIANRVETDLNLSKKTSISTVTSFMLNAGYTKEMSLKKRAVILWLEDGGNTSYTVALYEVWPSDNLKKRKRFLEIEVEKTNDLEEKEAIEKLKRISKNFTMDFKLKKPLKKSLYEIYSKKKYRMTNEKDSK